MRIESVRELKRSTEVRAALDGAHRHDAGPVMAGVPEGVPDEPPGVALGAAPTTRPDDFCLAIRVYDEHLLDSPVVRRIADAAHGEVDIAFIGIGFKEDGEGGTYRRRPLQIGCSIGHPRIEAGTLGCFVEGADGIRVLSNNHVFADEERAEMGDAVLQPGQRDGGGAPDDVVAELDHVVPLVVGRGNRMDAAAAKLVDGIEIEPGLVPGIGSLRGVGSLSGHERLAKVGRTTGLTRGRIVTLDLDDVPFDYDKGRVYFDNIIEVAGLNCRFTRGGDSGSLVVTDESAPQAVGLHIGGLPNGNSAVAPLAAVLEELGMALVT